MSRNDRTGGKTADRIQARRRDVALLRRSGLTMEQIADELDVSKGTVASDCQALRLMLHQLSTEDINAWRAAKLEEHQTLRQMAYDLIDEMRQAGDLKNIAQVMRRIIDLDERDSKLLGVDAPERVEQIRHEMTEEQADKILADYEASKP